MANNADPDPVFSDKCLLFWFFNIHVLFINLQDFLRISCTGKDNNEELKLHSTYIQDIVDEK